MSFDFLTYIKFFGSLLIVGIITGIICMSKKYHFALKSIGINTRKSNNRVSTCRGETDRDCCVMHSRITGLKYSDSPKKF